MLFILHADHEQNCSTNAMRAVGSLARRPVLGAMAGAAPRCYGPLHGGANEQVLRMIAEIGDVKNVPQFIEGVKAGKGRLMGFGHRVYKNYDPRAKIIKELADEVFEVTGREQGCSRSRSSSRGSRSRTSTSSQRKLYPNVDFYSGLIYQSMGFPVEMFTVLFAIARTAGWLAQWEEMLARQGAEDRAAASGLRRLGGTRRRAARRPSRDHGARSGLTCPTEGAMHSHLG